jgi:starvation-inducible DNA-binding protein
MAATTKKNDTKSFVYSTRLDIPVEIRSQFTPNPSAKTLIKQMTWVTWIPMISLLRFHGR